MKQPKKTVWMVVDPDGEIFDFTFTKVAAKLMAESLAVRGEYYDSNYTYTVAKYERV